MPAKRPDRPQTQPEGVNRPAERQRPDRPQAQPGGVNRPAEGQRPDRPPARAEDTDQPAGARCSARPARLEGVDRLAGCEPARLSIRLDLPGGRIGPGKVRLLEAIGAEGSISAGARALGMSYRRAWALVEETGRVLGGPAVATATGGAHGGGAVLTPRGQALVRGYREIERAAAAAAIAPLRSLAGGEG